MPVNGLPRNSDKNCEKDKALVSVISLEATIKEKSCHSTVCVQVSSFGSDQSQRRRSSCVSAVLRAAGGPPCSGMRIEDGNTTCVFTHKREKSQARQEASERASERARQARHAGIQAGRQGRFVVGWVSRACGLGGGERPESGRGNGGRGRGKR